MQETQLKSHVYCVVIKLKALIEEYGTYERETNLINVSKLSSSSGDSDARSCPLASLAHRRQDAGGTQYKGCYY